MRAEALTKLDRELEERVNPVVEKGNYMTVLDAELLRLLRIDEHAVEDYVRLIAR